METEGKNRDNEKEECEKGKILEGLGFTDDTCINTRWAYQCVS